MDLQWATSLASCLGLLFNYIPLTLYRLYVNIGKKDWLMIIMCFFILGSGSRSSPRMQMKEFSFGVRCKLEIFPLGSGSGSRMQSYWTYCMNLVLVCKHACVCFLRSSWCILHMEKMLWQKLAERKKSPEIAKLTTQSIVFLKGRMNEMFVNY